MGGMTGSPHDTIGRIVAAVSLPARDRATIALPSGEIAVAIAGQAGPVAGLAEALYAHFYCAPTTVQPSAMDPAAFLAGLRAANPVAPRYEQGWTVAGIDRSGILLAEASGRRRVAALAEIVPYAGGLAVGQPVRLALPREMVSGPGGHYIILGRPIGDVRAGRQVRFYWNISPDGAAPFLAAIGTGLDRRRIPFQAKVPADPNFYGRADCGVLYLDGEDVEAALDVIAASHEALAAFLRPEVPLFTRRLAPGLAFAESPSSGDSFGMHRCRLIAEGLVIGFEAGARTKKARVEAVYARLTGYGFDLAALERNPATFYPYRFELLAAA
jgi:hypothetical protein